MRQNPDIPVMWKKCHIFLKTSIIEHFISLNTCSVRSIKFSIDSFQLVPNHSPVNCWFVPCIRNLIVQIFPKVFIYFDTLSLFDLVFLGNYRFDLVHGSRTRELYLGRWVFNRKMFSFWSLHWYLDNPEILKSSITFDTFRYSNSRLAITTSLIFSVEISIEHFTLVGRISFGNKIIQALVQAFDSPKLPK